MMVWVSVKSWSRSSLWRKEAQLDEQWVVGWAKVITRTAHTPHCDDKDDNDNDS